MNFSILTIGDEICIGQIVNTNSSWLAEKMTSIGFSAVYHSAVSDNEDIILSELNRLSDNSDVLLITGGLGPTHDDITKEVLLKFFDDKYIWHEETLNYLINWFKSRNRELSDINKSQAKIPSKCIPLKNSVGTAPGLLFKLNNKLIVSMPGVPAEMEDIFSNTLQNILIEHFQKFSKNIQLYLTINTAGIFESALAELIGSPDNFPKGISLAYLPSVGKVRLRIGANSETKEKAQDLLNLMKNNIIKIAGKYIVGYGNDSLIHYLSELLKEKQLNVAVAESCTGGMLGAEFTELSGSSEYFLGGVIAYSNEVKHNLLNISNDIIDNYGAVSEQTAIVMARNIRQLFGSDYGISITGIAGPSGGTKDKPVGTIWIGISDYKSTSAKLFQFANSRELNRERAVTNALLMLKERIIGK